MCAKEAAFEKNMERLQQIVEQLESGELPLDKGVTLYTEGRKLAKACRDQLEKARLTVSMVGPEGLRPFDSGEGGPVE